MFQRGSKSLDCYWKTGTVLLTLLVLFTTSPVFSEEESIGFGNFCLSFPTTAETAPIADVYFLNNGKCLEIGGRNTQVSSGSWFGNEARIIFDGDPKTVFTGKTAGEYFRFDFWVLLQATDIVIHSENPAALKGAKMELLGNRLKTVYSTILDIPKDMTIAKINLKSGAVTALKTLPKMPQFRGMTTNYAITDLIAEGKVLPSTPEELSKLATVGASGAGPSKWTNDENGVLRLGCQDGWIKFNDLYLEDGKAFAVSIDLGKTQPKGMMYRPYFHFGKHSYKLDRYKDLQDPHKVNWNIRLDGEKNWNVTAVFYRKGDTINWAFYGDSFNTSGATEFAPGELEAKPRIKVQGHQAPGGWYEGAEMNPGIGFAKMVYGKPGKVLSKPLLKPTKLAAWPSNSSAWISKIRTKLKSKGITLPKLHLKSLYGPLQKEELETLKLAARHADAPTSNAGNSLIFKNEMDMSGLALILKMTNDLELLNILHTWSLSILEYRNDMPKGAKLPNMMFMYWNQPTSETEITKSWNYYGAGGWGWANGKPHLGTEISGAGGSAAMMHFPLYVSRHPKLWNKTMPGSQKTYLQQAKFLAKESQAVLEDFVYKYYIEDETGRAPNKPWNRYMQVIETCMNLVEVYDNLKGEKDFYNKAKRDKCQRVVDGFSDFFFDTRLNYTSTYAVSRSNQKKVATCSWRYMPKVDAYNHPDLRKDIFPHGSEDVGHGGIEVKTFGEMLTRGIRLDRFGRSFAHCFKNTLWEKIYGGKDKDGKDLINSHINGEGSYSHGSVGGFYLWPAFVDPNLYDHFATVGDRESLSSFCYALWVRQQLYKRGITGPGEENRKAPTVEVVTEKEVQDYNAKTATVTLSAKVKTKGGRTIKRIEWDFDGDSKTDATGKRVTYTYKSIGTHMPVVTVTDSEGWISSADACVVISELEPGTGTGKVNVSLWKGIESWEALKSSPKFPGKPDETFVQEDLALNSANFPTNNKVGAMVEGYLIPPRDAEYEFFMHVDDAGEVLISEDETPEKLQQALFVPSYMFFGHWSRGSKSISLKKGKKYFFRTIYFNNTHSGLMKVNWRVKGGLVRHRAIDSQYLSPVTPTK